MKRILAVFLGAILVVLQSPAANAEVTWFSESPLDTYNRPDLNPLYDVEQVAAAIFDNDADFLNFYLWMAQVPSSNMFNDGKGSWGAIFLDVDLDGKSDYEISTVASTMLTNRVGVKGQLVNDKTGQKISCDVSVFNNIDAQSKFIAFKFPRSCIGLQGTFAMQGYADYIANDQTSYDYAPTNFFTVSLPGSSNSSNTTSTKASQGSTYVLPSNLANASKDSTNYSSPPVNLTLLSSQLLPSVVTVKCDNGSGTGWSAEVQLSESLKTAGYTSLVITNYHVIAGCLTNKNVTLVLNSGTTVAGQIVSWNETKDVAGIAMKNFVPGLQWIGKSPLQGWWVGVLGSPLGNSNILTSGIISSVNVSTKKFTMTAAINPGNSGGPVFDNTGRVIGLATSKALLSDGQLAEGFGTAHGVPLLCDAVILCQIESDPWNGKPSISAGPSEAELLAKAEAEAKAKAEAEAKAKAEAEAKAKAEAEALLLSQKQNLCSEFNGDIRQTVLKLNLAKATYPKSASTFNSLSLLVPSTLDCLALSTNTFDSELSAQRKLLATFQSNLDQTIINAVKIEATASNKKTTITCRKGTIVKKITGTNPKCPAGYIRA